MARIRTIKPELPSDAALARCSRDARYVFVLLITQADDYGLVGASPRQILGTLFPLEEDVTSAMVGAWIGELVAAGLCRWRWTRDGAPVVELVNWNKHQRIDNRRRPVLMEQLDETRSDTPAFAQVFAESRREPAATRGESRLEPPTSDHGPPTKEKDRGHAETDAPEPFSTSASPAAPPGDDAEWVARLGPDGAAARAGFRRAHRHPPAFDAALAAIGPGGVRQLTDAWPVLGTALAQMLGNGERWNEALCAGYVRRLVAATAAQSDELPPPYLPDGRDNPAFLRALEAIPIAPARGRGAAA